MIVIIFICILSISINIFQFNSYHKEGKFYTEIFLNDFNSPIRGFDYYIGDKVDPRLKWCYI